MKNKGFTILELSIVLVIISFLIAAIYNSNNLLRQSMLKNIVKELYKYQTAFNSFKSQYNAIPGDFNLAQTIWPNASTANGNGNNYIEGASNSSNLTEDTYVYQHLYLAGVLVEQYIGGVQTPNRKVIGINLPKSRYDNGTYEMNTENIYGKTATYIEFGSLINSSGKIADGAILNSTDCNNIDQKIDDGIAYKGRILAGNSYLNSNCVDAGFSASVANYKYVSQNPSCRLMMIISGTN